MRNNDWLREALRGVPPTEWTRRPDARDDLRAQARELRARQYTMLEIARELGVAKSSVSLWTRDMPREGRISSEEIRARKAARAPSMSRAYWAEESPRREAARRAISEQAAAEIGPLADREVLIAGAIAYWCEGLKNKPHRRSNRVRFTNSDPGLIRLILRFLTLAGVERERIRCRVAIHERADVAGAEQLWRQVTQLPGEQFDRTSLKPHNPRPGRLNVGVGYRGCLDVTVLQGLMLYRQI